MSFRRFVHLVVNDRNIRRPTYSLRNIDMSHLFRRPLAVEEMEPCPLPTPAMSFCPPRSRYHYYGMNFMLLGGRHNKVLATDQTGRAVLYDPDRHAVHTLRAFTEPKQMPVSFTIGGDHLYVLDVSPAPGCNDTCFECLEYYPHGGDEDWYPYVLPPPPPLETDESDDLESSPCVDSCAVSGDGSRIWITDQHLGTYSFDTTVEVWSKVGNWALPFDGVTEYVPELGLWFGLKNEDRCVLCAVDLTTTSVPAVRSF